MFLNVNLFVFKAIPKWVQEPKDTEAVRGKDVIMKCDAVAKPVPKIEFLKDGITVAGDRFLQTGAQLTILRVESSDSGSYACVASNDAGHIQGNLRLTVLVGPVIQQFDNLVVDENRSGVLKCAVNEANPPPEFKWKYADTQQFVENVCFLSLIILFFVNIYLFLSD